ncbi:MAG: hypothetical protein ACRER2_18425, partial [Methylococcales bacterium]
RKESTRREAPRQHPDTTEGWITVNAKGSFRSCIILARRGPLRQTPGFHFDSNYTGSIGNLILFTTGHVLGRRLQFTRSMRRSTILQ